VKRLLLSLVVMLMAAAGWCQAPPKAKPVSPLLEYAGLWTAEFDGKVWLILRLELRGDQMSGSLVHPKSIEMNDNGGLKSVSEEQSTEVVAEAVVNPDGLLITLKSAETQERDRYQMRLILPDKETADLKMIGMPMPPGMPKPKPWRLVKSGTTTKQTAPRPR
jgi:hypothetical protein